MQIENFEEFKASVLEAYQNALENDWFFDGYTSRDVALDMIAFDATLEPYLEDDGDDEKLIAILVPIIDTVHNKPH